MDWGVHFLLLSIQHFLFKKAHAIPEPFDLPSNEHCNHCTGMLRMFLSQLMSDQVRLEGKPTIKSGLVPEDLKLWVARSTRAQSRGHHAIDRLEERNGRKRKRSTTFRERTRKDHRQSDQHWNSFNGNTRESSEREGGARMDFPERIDTILN